MGHPVSEILKALPCIITVMICLLFDAAGQPGGLQLADHLGQECSCSCLIVKMTKSIDNIYF